MRPARSKRGYLPVGAVAMILALLLVLTAVELSMRAAGGHLRFLEERASVSAGWERTRERILCLGESTTAPTDRPDHSWPRQLEAILNGRAGARRFAVINAGRSSTNSAVLLARLPGLLDVYTPQTVVVMMGINDPKWYGVLETAARRAGGWRGFMAGLRVWKLARYVRYELLRGTLLATTLRRRRPSHVLPAPGLSRECRRLLVGQAKDARIERACQRAVEADPDDWASHSNLVEFYRARRRYAKAEQVLRRNAARAQESEWRQVLLAEMLVLQDKTPEAEKLLWAVLGRSSDPAMVNRVLMSLDGLFQARGRPDLIGEAFRQVVAFETHGRGAEAGLSSSDSAGGAPEGVSPVTAANYRRLREILRKRGIRLVAMQYPTLSGAGLRAVFRDPENILFAENRGNFREALAESGYSFVFRDLAFGQWGHCTAAGDRLIAEVVERVLSAAQ
ncbi:MAG TPA: hypothetical protein DCZ01_05555 [Elusimicrobia bacterium]|nr:hypothetical protein [Elusimicrobiota bacterium]